MHASTQSLAEATTALWPAWEAPPLLEPVWLVLNREHSVEDDQHDEQHDEQQHHDEEKRDEQEHQQAEQDGRALEAAAPALFRRVPWVVTFGRRRPGRHTMPPAHSPAIEQPRIPPTALCSPGLTVDDKLERGAEGTTKDLRLLRPFGEHGVQDGDHLKHLVVQTWLAHVLEAFLPTPCRPLGLRGGAVAGD